MPKIDLVLLIIAGRRGAIVVPIHIPAQPTARVIDLPPSAYRETRA